MMLVMFGLLLTVMFFNNRDWPHNNIRMFRSVSLNDTDNPYSDGHWRFYLHDMDRTLWSVHVEANTFERLYERDWRSSRTGNHYFLVFNNPTFVREFVERAEYVLDNYFQVEQLLAVHGRFLAEYTPLLPDMYARFNMDGSVEASMARFDYYAVENIRRFLQNREYYYRQHLQHLLERIGLE